jgi:hypothetical protein
MLGFIPAITVKVMMVDPPHASLAITLISELSYYVGVPSNIFLTLL